MTDETNLIPPLGEKEKGVDVLPEQIDGRAGHPAQRQSLSAKYGSPTVIAEVGAVFPPGIIGADSTAGVIGVRPIASIGIDTAPPARRRRPIDAIVVPPRVLVLVGKVLALGGERHGYGPYVRHHVVDRGRSSYGEARNSVDVVHEQRRGGTVGHSPAAATAMAASRAGFGAASSSPASPLAPDSGPVPSAGMSDPLIQMCVEQPPSLLSSQQLHVRGGGGVDEIERQGGVEQQRIEEGHGDVLAHGSEGPAALLPGWSARRRPLGLIGLRPLLGRGGGSVVGQGGFFVLGVVVWAARSLASGTPGIGIGAGVVVVVASLLLLRVFFGTRGGDDDAPVHLLGVDLLPQRHPQIDPRDLRRRLGRLPLGDVEHVRHRFGHRIVDVDVVEGGVGGGAGRRRGGFLRGR
mmetsp:Transcript_28619/g.84308  ORF Transcript_28619/g.84308 Transcript_28619/m.84308 type:complete len:406 (-) Transcript_28619:1098-2315(-)